MGSGGTTSFAVALLGTLVIGFYVAWCVCVCDGVGYSVVVKVGGT